VFPSTESRRVVVTLTALPTSHTVKVSATVESALSSATLVTTRLEVLASETPAHAPIRLATPFKMVTPNATAESAATNALTTSVTLSSPTPHRLLTAVSTSKSTLTTAALSETPAPLDTTATVSQLAPPAHALLTARATHTLTLSTVPLIALTTKRIVTSEKLYWTEGLLLSCFCMLSSSSRERDLRVP